MKTHRIMALAVALTITALAVSACSTASTPNANGGNTNSNSTTKEAKPSPTPAQAAGDMSTPTATFKAFYEAARDRNSEAIKKTLSKGTIEFLETGAKAQNKTFEDAIKTIDAPPTLPETRNEKIVGDKATLEAKDDKRDGWETMRFVKEDGQWKVDLTSE
jgi:hypothetical protein